MLKGLKKTFQYMLLVKYDLIRENDKEIKFYFEEHENQVTHKVPEISKHNGNPYLTFKGD